MNQIGQPISISVPEEVRDRAKRQEEILAQQGITEEEFQKVVEKKTNDKGLSFVLAVYQTFEEFLDQEMKIFRITLACKKGCSACCYTMVTCMEREMDEIVKYVREIPRAVRRPLVRELEKVAIKWRNYYEQNKSALTANPFQAFKDWQGKPCPFLNKTRGGCEIYPVRIIDCRTLTSLIPCRFPAMSTAIPCELRAEGPGRYRFRCESWATNLIMEEQQRKLGLSDPSFSPVTPVSHWLLIKKF